MSTALAKDPTPKVEARYGAPLGRTSDPLTNFEVMDTDSRFTLRRIYIDHQGYDPGGAYWGIGSPLFYWAVTIKVTGEGWETADEFNGFFRALTREKAKQIIRNIHPKARFFR
jgi:hypothetical protein